jgi:hypothetical protein
MGERERVVIEKVKDSDFSTFCFYNGREYPKIKFSHGPWLILIVQLIVEKVP